MLTYEATHVEALLRGFTTGRKDCPACETARDRHRPTWDLWPYRQCPYHLAEATVMGQKPFQAYQQLATRLRAEFEQLEPGTRIPTETELGTRFGVSRTTIRRAMKVLEDEGLVHVAFARTGRHVAGEGCHGTEVR